MQKRPSYILPLIVLSQFAGTSLWFVGNAILLDMQQELNIQSNQLGNITSIVQFGFIAGTLMFAIFSIADRFSSGIYPVGMKIAADWYEKGLGKALGYLVGALVLGTAFPHLLRSNLYALPGREVLLFTSAFAAIGGILILIFVGDGPYKKPVSRFQLSAVFQIFRSANFRSAAFGYFGHMWELYTFWAFVPSILSFYVARSHQTLNIPLWSFIIIAIGSLSCVAGGYLSQKIGSGRVAFYALFCSGLCCLASFKLFHLPLLIFILVMLIWGISVIADSPQFSTLVAQTAIPEYKGTALTIVTCIGFAITIGSVQLIEYAFNNWMASKVFVLLFPGPLIGLLFLLRLVKERK